MQPLLLAISLAASVAAQPVAPASLGPAPWAQIPFDIAANGNSCLALWRDSRSTLDLDRGLHPEFGFFDTPVESSGVPMIPAGRRLSARTYDAKLAPSGAGYAAV